MMLNVQYACGIIQFEGFEKGVFNLTSYSLIITTFIYAMLTIEYKNKKQYLIANGTMIVIYFIFYKIHTLGDEWLSISGNYFISYVQDILLIMYLVFLTGNSIKKK